MLSRRHVLGLMAVMLASPARAEHPSVAYMRTVGKDMLAAHRQGTVSAFMRVIQRHADVSGIGAYSLGDYNSKLPAGQRARYNRGVANFMARYFAEQSHIYTIAKYDIGEATVDGDDILVASKVYLMDGQTYNVMWRLHWTGGRYRVTDAKVLGFSLTYMQRGIFTSFVAKQKGNIGPLIVALNR
jgi:phospholipid transport system substrate-binding protein